MKKLKKNIQVGKVSILITFIYFFITSFSFSTNEQEVSENLEGEFIEITILDKVSSKNSFLKIKIGEEKIFKNLLIKSLKCKNSEFLHFLPFIKRFLNFFSSPILSFKRLFFELTLSKIFISINCSLKFSKAIIGDEKIVIKK